MSQDSHMKVVKKDTGCQDLQNKKMSQKLTANIDVDYLTDLFRGP